MILISYMGIYLQDLMKTTINSRYMTFESRKNTVPFLLAATTTTSTATTFASGIIALS
jgi:hypothetical protein